MVAFLGRQIDATGNLVLIHAGYFLIHLHGDPATLGNLRLILRYTDILAFDGLERFGLLLVPAWVPVMNGTF